MRFYIMDDTAFKVYASYLDNDSNFTLSKRSNLHVLGKSEGKVFYDDYVDVYFDYNTMDGYLGVGIYWDEYEHTIGGLFSNIYYLMKFYPIGEKLHIDGKNKNGLLINIIISLPPKLRG